MERQPQKVEVVYLEGRTVTRHSWMSVALWAAVGGGQKLRPGECHGLGGILRNMVGETKCLSVLWDSPPPLLGWQMYVEMPQGVGQVLLSLANWLFRGINYWWSWESAPLWQSRGQEGYLKSWVVWPGALRAPSGAWGWSYSLGRNSSRKESKAPALWCLVFCLHLSHSFWVPVLHYVGQTQPSCSKAGVCTLVGSLTDFGSRWLVFSRKILEKSSDVLFSCPFCTTSSPLVSSTSQPRVICHCQSTFLCHSHQPWSPGSAVSGAWHRGRIIIAWASQVAQAVIQVPAVIYISCKHSRSTGRWPWRPAEEAWAVSSLKDS